MYLNRYTKRALISLVTQIFKKKKKKLILLLFVSKKKLDKKQKYKVCGKLATYTKFWKNKKYLQILLSKIYKFYKLCGNKYNW